MKGWIASFFSAALLGCTTISITEKDGKVRVSRSFGAITIEMVPGSKSVLAEAVGLGYLTGPLGTTIGFSKNSFAVLGRDCRLILWNSDKEQAKQLQELLGNHANVCIISPENKGESK